MGKFGELDSAFAVCEQLFLCCEFENIERQVLAPIAKYLDADTGAYVQFSPDTNRRVRLSRLGTIGVPAAMQRQYPGYYVHMDPIFDALTGDGRIQRPVLCTSEICDYSEFTKGEFYNDFLGPIHVHHVLGLFITAGNAPNQHFVFGFHRPKNAPPFGEKEKRRAQRLAGATTSALRNLVLREALTLQEAAIAQFESAHPQTGIALLDEKLELVYISQKASLDLQADPLGDVVGARLLQVRDACRSLARRCGTSASMEVSSPDWGNMLAIVAAMRTEDGRMLFAVHTGPRELEAKLHQICSDYAMTHRESDIVRLLISGLPNAEISRHLLISPRTVENHLRSIYSKTGVNRRTQLLSKFLT
jgi:DNA-binding CsgD family transcriptional regulator